MPFATVRYDEGLLVFKQFLPALQELPQAIARWLSCPDKNGQLEPGDIEVKFEKQLSVDISGYQIEILISAMDFPSRKADIQGRTDQIATEVINMLARAGIYGYEMCVFITLSPAGFASRLIQGGKH